MEAFLFTDSSSKPINKNNDSSKNIVDFDNVKNFTNPLLDDVDLPPLPPEDLDNDSPLPFKQKCINSSAPSDSPLLSFPLFNKLDIESIPTPGYLESKAYAFYEDSPDVMDNGSFTKNNDKLFTETEIENKKFTDDKYSPSKVESDDESQEFIAIKPKVLGKEQAKKRLMAFSLAKQHNTVIKKQNKVTTSAKGSKEKPPNRNKSSGVQEQFRATISAIEEEKKKMMQNMPNYLLLEASDLAKSSHTIIKPSLHLLEKNKSENESNPNKNPTKEEETLNKPSEQSKISESERKFTRSKSQSRRIRSRSKERRRSRSRKKSRSPNKFRKRSRSRSRSRKRSRSRTRKPREDKNDKVDKKDFSFTSGKVLIQDWTDFKNSGLILTSNIDEMQAGKDFRRRSPSPKSRADFKPTFNYLRRGRRLMGPLKVRCADNGRQSPILFSEKVVKYTRVKPTIIWCENPSHSTDFFMSKQMLLENCEQRIAEIVLFITENNNSQIENHEKTIKTRLWYPRDEYLTPTSTFTCDVQQKVGEENTNSPQATHDSIPLPSTAEHQNIEADVSDNMESGKINKRERHISLVNDSYLSDEEGKMEEMIVGNVKVQLDVGLNSVKVRSKWDSDYEGGNSDKDGAFYEEAIRGIDISKKQSDKSALKTKEENVLKVAASKINNTPEKKIESQNSVVLNLPKNSTKNTEENDAQVGNLVSEYEEFLKMVSFNPSDSGAVETLPASPKKGTISEDIQLTKKRKSEEECTKSKSFGVTDWDQESDREEKSTSKKINYGKDDSDSEFLQLKDVKLEGKNKKNKNKTVKVKTEKLKQKKKYQKKLSKGKKKKYKRFSTSDSSSDSYDSDTISDSEDSSSSKKKKNRKSTKATKKSRRRSSSSDSEDKSSKKKKSKKKKAGKIKKRESSDDSEETETEMLKQLDFKKQLIMKKIEEIDSISERCWKKKEIQKKGEEELEEPKLLENYTKVDSSKKTNEKIKKKKKKKKAKDTSKKSSIRKSQKKESRKSESSSESDSESSDQEVEERKKKKKKKAKKKNRDSSESSESEYKADKVDKQNVLINVKNIKSLNKNEKKIKKKQRKTDYSSSYSESENSSPKANKKGHEEIDGKKILDDEVSKSSLKEKFSFEDEKCSANKEEFPLRDSKSSWKMLDGKDKTEKDGDDWESSSSLEESVQECKTRESSWDEKENFSEKKTEFTDESKAQDKIHINDENRNFMASEKELNEKNVPVVSDTIHQPIAETLKTSLSNFSFNENSFCSFGQELSRDFFLTERSFSNSELVGINENLASGSIELRPFHSVSKSMEVKKPAESELYSPGCSDSELSDAETYEKSEKTNSNSNAFSSAKDEVYDPLNCESDASVENNEIEVSSIPLPRVSDILLPGETRNFENVGMTPTANLNSSSIKNTAQFTPKDLETPLDSPACVNNVIAKTSFTPSDFTPVATPKFLFSGNLSTPPKRQIINVRAQQKLISKAASVFQDESDDENLENVGKEKATEVQAEATQNLKKKNGDVEKTKSKNFKNEENEGKEREEKTAKEILEKNKEKSPERERKIRRSLSLERKVDGRLSAGKMISPVDRKENKTPDYKVKEKREIRSDSFEIEPLKSSSESNELEQTVQPIPVLTGLGAVSSSRMWSRSQMPGYTCTDFSDIPGSFLDHAESFDIYPPEDSNLRNQSYNREECLDEKSSKEKHRDDRSKKEKRRSRSRSISPRKRRRSKSPERRNRSPRKRSLSPKRRDRSSYSPRKRSPKRKSPSRRHRSSRSPDRRRRSWSRSPRRRRSSPSRRSRSSSPRRHRSPKKRIDSPKRKESPSRTFSPAGTVSPRMDSHFSHNYSSTLQNRIPVIGAEDVDMEMSPVTIRSSPFDTPIGFTGHSGVPDLSESDMKDGFYNRQYSEDFSMTNYPEEVGVNNLITIKNNDTEKINSPERLSLDQRIELELGVQLSTGPSSQNEQYQLQNQSCEPFQDPNHFQNSYNCDNISTGNENFYQNQNLPMTADFNNQYFNGHQPTPNYGPFQQYSNPPSVQSSVMQVGNIVEVVPAMQHPPPPPPLSSKSHHIRQVGNVLQVVPSPKAVPPPVIPSPGPHSFGPPPVAPSLVKTQKATAVVAPSSIVPTPNPEAVINPLIKAIQLEREKRRKEKEKRKAEREARRKARQLKREAKMMSVNEKLKKSVQDEGLMLGQEVDDDELLDGSDLPSPPIPVEIVTVTSQNNLPPAGKGILITAGFMPKPPSEKKEVKFADGVCPGEGTSSSDAEEILSPPPKPKLPKEKRFKKKKTKVKKKVKVQIIRQIIQDEDGDEDDDLSPPPPPPGDPPPVFFARFPFVGDAQFPVYQTQTTMTTLTTVQFPAQTFQ